jgi:peptidoglycan hydrolase-like protein with peptidoglycan-binding domain
MSISRYGVLTVFCMALAVAVPALADPSIADVQWAQRLLTEKGFDIGGRANGQMTGQTRAALKAYQKSAGIPATGELDGATTARMLADRQAKPTGGTQGSLTAPKPGAPRVVERDVKPKAAPTERVDTAGGGENINPAVVVGGPVDSGSFDPSAPVSRNGAMTGPDGQATPSPLLPTGPTESRSVSYARPLVASVLLGTLIALIGAWWLSGRRRTAAAPEQVAASDGKRVEPTFGAAAPRAANTGGPTLQAIRPRRR